MKNLQNMSLILSLTILIALTSVSHCKIKPGKGIPDMYVLDTDRIAVNLEDVFDTSEAKLPLISKKTSIGYCYGDDVPFLENDYAKKYQGLKGASMTKPVGENIAAFVFEDGYVVLQEFDQSGKNFADDMLFKAEKDLICTGFEYNTDRNYVYIGCFGIAQGHTPGKLIIYTVDMHSKTTINTVEVDQTDGFFIQNSVQLRVIRAPQDANEETYLIAYDQGVGISKTSKLNHQFRIFRNVAYRKLTYYYLGQTDFATDKSAITYDYWTYQSTMIWTGRLSKSDNHIAMAQCKLDNSKKTLFCSNERSTGITYGFITIQNENILITADKPNKTITVSKLNGKFTDPNWSKTTLNKITKANFLPGEFGWITGGQWSAGGSSLQWTTKGQGKEVATTLVTWYLNNADTIPVLGYTRDKALICSRYVGKDKGLLFRNILAMSYIDPSKDLKYGNNPVNMEIADVGGSQKSSGTIHKIESVLTQPKTIAIKDFEIESGLTATLTLPKDFIESGNFLSVSVDNNFKQNITVDAFFNKQVQIDFDQDIGGQLSCDGTACIKASSSTVGFYVCSQHQGPGTTISCKIQTTHSLARGETASLFVSEIRAEGIFTYVTNSSAKTTTAIIVKGNQKSTASISGVATDAAGEDIPGTNRANFALVMGDVVKILEVNAFNISDLGVSATLDSNYFNGEDFCPVSITATQPEYDSTSLPVDSFSILSSCNKGTYTSAAVYQWSLVNDPSIRIPISSANSPSQICAFGSELLVKGTESLQGVASFDDANLWSIPYDQIGINPESFELNCFELYGLAGVVSQPQGKTSENLTVIRANSGRRQDRRFPFVLEGLNYSNGHSFSFLGSVLYTGTNSSGKVDFIQVFTDPQIVITAAKTTFDVPTDITVHIKNSAGTSSQKVNITVKKQAKNKIKKLIIE